MRSIQSKDSARKATEGQREETGWRSNWYQLGGEGRGSRGQAPPNRVCFGDWGGKGRHLKREEYTSMFK